MEESFAISDLVYWLILTRCGLFKGANAQEATTRHEICLDRNPGGKPLGCCYRLAQLYSVVRSKDQTSYFSYSPVETNFFIFVHVVLEEVPVGKAEEENGEGAKTMLIILHMMVQEALGDHCL